MILISLKSQDHIIYLEIYFLGEGGGGLYLNRKDKGVFELLELF